MIKGLRYIHSANVIHRDLKPSNLVLNTSCELKICDFGLARAQALEGDMTQYVVTRWYRAPELLIGCDEYTNAIDVWSTGCILAELLSGKPFFEGRDYMHQLRLIIGVLGKPSEDELSFIQDQKILEYIQMLPSTQGVPFSSLFPNANPLAVDVLEKTLVFHPAKRCNMVELLEHPYFASYRDKKNEIVAEQPFHCDFGDGNLGEKDLRQLLMEEIHFYHPKPTHRKLTSNEDTNGTTRERDFNKAS